MFRQIKEKLRPVVNHKVLHAAMALIYAAATAAYAALVAIE